MVRVNCEKCFAEGDLTRLLATQIPLYVYVIQHN